MKTIILRIPEIDYVLIHWAENTLTPWVAAWAYNEDGGYWGQGHYFTNKADALEYLANTYKERYPVVLERKIAEILVA